jgi:hypothetical protein
VVQDTESIGLAWTNVEYYTNGIIDVMNILLTDLNTEPVRQKAERVHILIFSY